ncbi:MAG: T9SS type A sorting domain-containing protein [bacterium]|nr:T9SS type A sorting domain-containing protein [Candidatus Kapabacteria bacterium]
MPGDLIPVTIVVASALLNATCTSPFERIALRFRSSMLSPAWIDGGEIIDDSLAGSDRIITIELTSDTLLLDMIAAFGDTTNASIVLEAAGNDECMRVVGDTLARYQFNGCDVGGRRYFVDRDAAMIKPVRPDPVRGQAFIEFRTLEEGSTRLDLFDALGRRVATMVDEVLTPGEHVATLDVDHLAHGVYLLVMRTPTRDVTRRITVAR